MKYTYELARPIAQQFGLREEDVTWALEQTVEHLVGPHRKFVGRGRERVQEDAVTLVTEWLTTGHEWAVDTSSLEDICAFLRCHAVPCAWAVLQSKARAARDGRASNAVAEAPQGRDMEKVISQLTETIWNQLVLCPPPGTRAHFTPAVDGELVENLARTIATAIEEYGR